VTVRPVRVFPFVSFNVVVSVVVPPAVSVVLLGLTATEATGASVTVMVDDPDAVPLVAVMVAVPGATPVTTPPAETLAVVFALDVQVTARPTSTLPPASLTVAASDVVPATTIVALVGVTVTLAAGTTPTVIDAVPL